jgi:hypothetical protein
MWVDQVDYWQCIRWITNQIFIVRGQADYWPNIHLVYVGVMQITNWIFINWARWIGIEYSIVIMIRLGESELNI